MVQLVDTVISKITKCWFDPSYTDNFEFSLIVERRAYTSLTVEHNHQLEQEISLTVEHGTDTSDTIVRLYHFLPKDPYSKTNMVKHFSLKEIKRFKSVCPK